MMSNNATLSKYGIYDELSYIMKLLERPYFIRFINIYTFLLKVQHVQTIYNI